MNKNKTKFLTILLVLSFSLLNSLFASELSRGSSMEAVKKVLGTPQGKMKKGSTVIWMYSEGVVEFKNGVLVESDILSAKQLEDREVKKKANVQKAVVKKVVSEDTRNEYQRAGIIVQHSPGALEYFTKSFTFHSPVDYRLAPLIVAGAQSFHDHMVLGYFPSPFFKKLDMYYSISAADTVKLLESHGKKDLSIGYGRYFNNPPAIYTHREMPDNSLSGMGTVFHEMIHHFNRLHYPDSPAWFNEGVACFLGEQTRICNNQLSLGHPNPWREQILRDLLEGGEKIDIKRLVSLNDYEFYSRKDWYHFARAFFYWLHEIGSLKMFMAQAKRGGYTLAALEQATNLREEIINQELTEFIKKKCYPAAYYKDGVASKYTQVARILFREALDINNDYLPARIELARIFMREKNFKDCEDLLRPYVENGNPRYMCAINSVMGDSFRFQNLTEDALKCYKRCWQYGGYEDFVYEYLYWIGFCYEKLGDKDSAAHWYRRYIQENWRPEHNAAALKQIKRFFSDLNSAK